MKIPLTPEKFTYDRMRDILTLIYGPGSPQRENDVRVAFTNAVVKFIGSGYGSVVIDGFRIPDVLDDSRTEKILMGDLACSRPRSPVRVICAVSDISDDSESVINYLVTDDDLDEGGRDPDEPIGVFFMMSDFFEEYEAYHLFYPETRNPEPISIQFFSKAESDALLERAQLLTAMENL